MSVLKTQVGNMLRAMEDDKPYSYRCVNDSLWGPSTYEILFEGNAVRTLTASPKTIEDMVFLLNTAFELGFGSGQVAAATR